MGRNLISRHRPRAAQLRGGLLVLAPVFLSACSSDSRNQSQQGTATVALYGGRWTRSDGRLYEVDDDGTTLRGKLTRDPSSYTFELSRQGNELVGTARIHDGDQVLETKWHLHPKGPDRVAGDTEYVDVDPRTGKVVGRGLEPLEFQIATRPASTNHENKSQLQAAADATTAEEESRARELAKLRAAADRATGSSDTEDAQKKALQDAADKEAALAERDETERQKLRDGADAAAARPNH